MRRTTIILDDDLAELLEHARRQRDVSTAAVVREALAAYLTKGSPRGKRLPFAALGGSGRRETARNAEAILAREWGGKKRAASQRRGR
jgi:hypothetical protein